MKLPNINNQSLTGCFIAGGAVLSTVTKTEVADYDLYPKSREGILDVCLQLLDAGLYVVNISDKAVTFKSNIEINSRGERILYQVIRDGFPTAKTIFNWFDFTVCMGAFDCDSGEYVFGEDFWPDVASKTLRFNPNTKWPLASLIRTNKYFQKGYKTGKGELAKIALAVAKEGEPTSWEELEQVIGGVYGKSLKLQSEGVEYSFEKAVEILGDIDTGSFYVREKELRLGEDDLITLLSEETLIVYSFKESYFLEKDGWVTPFRISLDLEQLQVDEKPLEDLKYIKGMKRLRKDTNGSYIGASYNGYHNGVTYKDGKEVIWEESPYLFAYYDPEATSFGRGTHKCEVLIPVDNIQGISYDKIQTNKMVCEEIVET